MKSSINYLVIYESCSQKDTKSEMLLVGQQHLSEYLMFIGPCIIVIVEE